jgi:uncharacterized protein with GYD domain
MATYVILSRISPDAFRDPKDFKKLADAVSSRIAKECRGVVWKQSFATLGRFVAQALGTLFGCGVGGSGFAHTRYPKHSPE